MKKYLLWLDDTRCPYWHEWNIWISHMFPGEQFNVIWVSNYDEFVDYIKSFGIPDVICFDHDLGEQGENERNGLTCAKYVIDCCIDNNRDIPRFAIQSSNPAGGENIRALMNNYHNFYIKNKEILAN